MKFKDYLKEFETHYDSKNGRFAWEKVEEKHFEKHGKSKYRTYPVSYTHLRAHETDS